MFKLQTSNWNSKLPAFYLIPKKQSAQREGKKEVERMLAESRRGVGGEKVGESRGETEAHHTLPIS